MTMTSDPSPRPHVLLLDDDHDVLGANARFLRLNNLDVTVADNPERALQLIKDSAFDLVITDLRMPDMSGLQFATALRETQPLLPILFLSAYAVITDVVSAMRLGAADFLEKPVEPDILIERVTHILAPHQRAAALQRVAFDAADQTAPFKNRVHAYERYLIEHALVRFDGRVSDVLNALQINRRTLNDKMTKLGISRHSLKAQD